MQTFKIFEEREANRLEAAVNNWANAHDLKIIDFKYSHTTEANGSSSYSAGVLFEPTDPSGNTAREIERKKAHNEMIGRKIVENGGLTVIIRGKTGTCKASVSDLLSKFALDCGISVESECERRLDDPFAEPAELVKLGKKGHRK